MTQRDYIIDLVKEFARFVALLLGLIENKDLAEAEVQIDAFLTKYFGLNAAFDFEELKDKFANKVLNISELSNVLDVVLMRAKMYKHTQNEQSRADYQKALQIIELIEQRATTYDMTLANKKKEVLTNLA
jgi:hypothetical protein